MNNIVKKKKKNTTNGLKRTITTITQLVKHAADLNAPNPAPF